MEKFKKISKTVSFFFIFLGVLGLEYCIDGFRPIQYSIVVTSVNFTIFVFTGVLSVNIFITVALNQLVFIWIIDPVIKKLNKNKWTEETFDVGVFADLF